MRSKIDLLHKISLYAVVGVAFIALYGSNRLAGVTSAGFVVAFIASWFTEGTRLSDESNNIWWNILIVGFLGLSVGLAVLNNASYLNSAIRFVLVLTAIKLLSRNGARDDLQLYALSFLGVASATAVTMDVDFGILFAVYVLAGTFSLALFHLDIELENRRSTPLRRAIPFDAQYITVLAVISLGIFASSLAIFFGFPRIGLGFFAQQGRGGSQMTGFSESVELGNHGVIRDNPQVALRVEFPDGKPVGYSSFHWRMITFDRYNGRGWQRTMGESTVPLRGRDGVYDLSELYPDSFAEAPPEDMPKTMEIYLEPLESDLIPVLWPSRRIGFTLSHQRTLPGSPRSGSLKRDPYGDVHHTVPSDVGLPYVVHTGRRPSPAKLRRVDAPIPRDSEHMKRYLQMPEVSERFRQLAARITREADTTYAKAEAIEEHLRSNYSYTTNLPKTDGERPVESFLFDTRRGHCEYYATAMVLLLRSQGIPARMVNGFLGGNWNAVGGFLAVRQGDAHSWVEVFIPGYRWVQMDPTPAGLSTDEGSLGNWFRDTYDALRMQWIRYVIEYDLDSQLDFMRSASDYLSTDGLMGGGDDGGRRKDDNENDGGGLDIWPLLSWGGLLGIVLGSAYTTRRVHPRFDRGRLVKRLLVWGGLGAAWASLWWGISTGSGLFGAGIAWMGVGVGAGWALRTAAGQVPPVTRMFLRIEHTASRAGLPRRADEAPGHYLQRLADAVPDATRKIQRFERMYMAARFGGRELDAATRRSAQKTAKAIRKAIQGRRR